MATSKRIKWDKRLKWLIPHFWRIAGLIHVRIKAVKPLPKRKRRNRFGEIHRNRKNHYTIFIDPTLSRELTLYALSHEAAHCVYWKHGKEHTEQTGLFFWFVTSLK